MKQQPNFQSAILLRETRELAGLTQTEAAKRCEVSFSAYEKWERGAIIKRPMLIGCLVLLDAPKEMIAKVTDAEPYAT